VKNELELELVAKLKPGDRVIFRLKGGCGGVHPDALVGIQACLAELLGDEIKAIVVDPDTVEVEVLR
jgi:hypothetical protein